MLRYLNVQSSECIVRLLDVDFIKLFLSCSVLFRFIVAVIREVRECIRGVVVSYATFLQSFGFSKLCLTALLRRGEADAARLEGSIVLVLDALVRRPVTAAAGHGGDLLLEGDGDDGSQDQGRAQYVCIRGHHMEHHSLKKDFLIG